MFFRRRSSLKYSLIIFVIWVFYSILFRNRQQYGNLDINQEIINKVVEKAIEHQELHEEAKAPKQDISKEKEVKDENKKTENHGDHDHPEEERKKANEQKDNLERKVQVKAYCYKHSFIPYPKRIFK